MSFIYLLTLFPNSEYESYLYFDSFKESLAYYLNNYESDDLLDELLFGEEKNLENIVICSTDYHHNFKIEKIEKIEVKNNKFDFDKIKEIENYKIYENLLITDKGSYIINEEELEKFNKLIIFK